jgi:co-chaperonin GroES (HSP10)
VSFQPKEGLQLMARSNHKMKDIAEFVGPRDKALLHFLAGHHKKQVVLHSQVLVAGYIAGAKSKGGIIFIDKTVEEDRWQGNIGLVIALGKGAFKDDAVAKFHGDKLKLGDWVMYLPADGVSLFINQVPCRLFQDTRILMKVDNPEIYY